MAKILKGKSFCWYGYLMAGSRSSPVLQDRRLETGNPKTIYMFNLKRGEIIQYAREIVEQKLRDLKPDETAFIEDLDAGYKKARRSFKGHKTGKRSVTDAVIVPLREDADFGDDDDIIDDDSDTWLDSREA
jgi:DNA replication initiation complex subunit (GINS family)